MTKCGIAIEIGNRKLITFHTSYTAPNLFPSIKQAAFQITKRISIETDPVFVTL